MGTTRVIDGRLELPPEAAKWANPEDDLAVFVIGDTLIIKKMHLPRLSELAERAIQGNEPSMDEIAGEVHAFRRGKRNARRP